MRLPQVVDWLSANQPDVLCLQETKLQDKDFPLAEINDCGYQALFSGQIKSQLLDQGVSSGPAGPG